MPSRTSILKYFFFHNEKISDLNMEIKINVKHGFRKLYLVIGSVSFVALYLLNAMFENK
jgi:hypothetical protein